MTDRPRVSLLSRLRLSRFSRSQYLSKDFFSDQGFARLCFLVFAVGSLYVEDLRVSFPREDGGVENDCSRGWM